MKLDPKIQIVLYVYAAFNDLFSDQGWDVKSDSSQSLIILDSIPPSSMQITDNNLKETIGIQTIPAEVPNFIEKKQNLLAESSIQCGPSVVIRKEQN